MSDPPAPTPMLRHEGRHLFGDSPENYEAARPPYPGRVYDILVERCGLGAGTKAFEIGPATGLATRELLARGCRTVVAVEPDERLAAYLARWAREAGAPLTVRNSTFEAARLATGGYDLGVAATSFHWLDQRAGLRKVHRLLRPGGWWAMWWNIFGDAEGYDAFHEATGRLMTERTGMQPGGATPGSPPFALDRAARLADMATAGLLGGEVEVIRWVHRFTPESTRALYATFSGVTRLPVEQQDALLHEIERVAREEFGGHVDRTLLTAVYTALRP